MSEQHETISYDFQANGIRDVTQAFQTIEQRMLHTERLSLESARREAMKRLDIARDSASRRTEIEKKAADARTKADQDALARALGGEKQLVEANKRAAQERKEIETRLGRDIVQIREEAAKRTVQIAQEETRKIAAEYRRQEAEVKVLAARRKQFNERISGIAVGSAGSTISRMASWGGAALTLGGALSVTNAAQNYMSAETASISLANSMYNPNDQEQQAWLRSSGMKRFDDKAIMSLAGTAQAASGISKDQLASGWQDYIAKSSDWKAIATKEGQGTLIELAKMAKATGTDFGQLMSAAGSLRVQNENLKPDEMLQMMRTIIGQGKMGAVEMKDLASHASIVTSGAGSYAMGQTQAQKALLGLSQIAIRTSGSPAEAATAVARFSSDVQGHASKMKDSFGIDAIADKKTGALKSPSEILAEIFEKTGGNSAKFGEGKGNVGLGRESVRIAQALMPTYQSAVHSAKNRGVTDDKQLAKIGANAVRSEVQKFENAGYEKSDIDEDLRRRMKGTQERFAAVTRDLSDKLEVRVIPFLEKLAVSLEKNAPEIDHLMDGFARLATFIVENPFKGMGAIVAAAVAKDLAAAGIQAAAEKALATSLGSAFGKGGLVVAEAALTIQAATFAIDELWKDKNRDDARDFAASRNAFVEAKAYERDAIEGKATNAKQAQLVRMRQEMAEQLAYDKANQYEISWPEAIGKTFSLGRGEGDESERFQKERDTKVKQTQQALDELNKAIYITARQMVSFSRDAGPASPNHPSRLGPMTSPQRK